MARNRGALAWSKRTRSKFNKTERTEAGLAFDTSKSIASLIGRAGPSEVRVTEFHAISLSVGTHIHTHSHTNIHTSRRIQSGKILNGLVSQSSILPAHTPPAQKQPNRTY